MINIQRLAADIPVKKIQGHFRAQMPLSSLQAADSFAPNQAQTAKLLNSRLKSVYGIDSDIGDPKLLGRIFSVVQEFCDLNGDKKLFENLSIKEGKIYSKGYGQTTRIGDKYSVTFNKDIDWKNLKSVTEDLFNKGKIGSKNPNYLIYKNLGDYLISSRGQASYRKCQNGAYKGEAVALPFRICNTTDLREFNSHVIASKMSKEYLPKGIEARFRENTGSNLKFPEAVCRYIEGSKTSFKTAEEAAEYLKKYGINAEFSNTRQANACVQAVEDLSEAAGDKKVFSGLTISPAKGYFEDNDVVADFMFDYTTHENKINLNPDYDWETVKKTVEESFDCLFSPTARVKDFFTHELSHYLDFTENPERFIEMEEKFDRFNKTGMFLTSKVSGYSNEHPAEFCAEYVAGRMAGLEYPKVTNDLFREFWNGRKLNFPASA